MKSNLKYLIILIFLLIIPVSVSAITWINTGGCWTATNGNQTLKMWNATGTSTYTIPANVTQVWYTVVGGGGSGGAGSSTSGGGGGGGGVLNGTYTVTPLSIVTVIVGSGGNKVNGNNLYSAGINGSLSRFDSFISYGGGFGGAYSNGSSAGSYGTGGGGAYNTIAAGSGTSPMGFNGGAGNAGTNQPGGGGGGSGATGSAATATNGGNGGAGNVSNITGILTNYGGGGGGGTYNGGIFGNGGLGGGGNGTTGFSANATSGTDGLGGGGGGIGSIGANNIFSGAGGSGVVIISYPTSATLYSSFSNIPNPSSIGQTVVFNDTSTGSPITWNWSFGDGGTSQTQNVTHTFSSPGTYSVYLNVTNSTGAFSNNSQNQFINPPLTWINTGGCWTATNGNQTLKMWNATGTSTYTIPANVTQVWYTVVGGGGSGGAGLSTSGGGGGGGGVLNGTYTVTPLSIVTVIVGSGGNKVNGNNLYSAGINGSLSRFDSFISYGGGFGGAYSNGSSAGSYGTGGGGAYNTIAAGSGTSPMGFNGGAGNAGTNQPGGGGGGSGATGSAATATNGGNGGAGNVSNITGILTNYGGGGGGGTYNGGIFGNGGLGGGGNGTTGFSANATSGTDGLGGGGGGIGSIGAHNIFSGAGGSGVVIISYPTSATLYSSFSNIPNPSSIGQTVVFNDTSTGSPITWNWSFGDGGTSQTQNVTHTFSSPGTYSVYLNVTNSTGAFSNNSQNQFINSPPPVANFTSNVTIGAAPLAVQFNDTSTNMPTTWNWSFGNNAYNMATWTQINSSAFTGRYQHMIWNLKNGTIIIGGGYNAGGSLLSDVWKSTDNGLTWKQTNASAPWGGRQGAASTVDLNGNLLLMGGYIGVDLNGTNDVWKSTDLGSTWTQINASAGWQKRILFSATTESDGSIIIGGGSFVNASGGSWGFSDVWRSTDNGSTWIKQNASAWPGRQSFGMVYDNSNIVILGGYTRTGSGSSANTNFNDVWVSSDHALTWKQVNASAGWDSRDGLDHQVITMPDNSILLLGGVHENTVGSTGIMKSDVWRSTDIGTTWTQLSTSSPWGGGPNTGRDGAGVAVGSDGSIIITAGTYQDGFAYSDIWSLPSGIGSTIQNATYNYLSPGNYTVILNVTNNEGSNSIQKVGYITVTPPAPTAVFTSNITSGIATLVVQFNDTSLNAPTSWTWNATNVTGNNTPFTFSTSQNPIYGFGIGNFSILLNATNAFGTNTSTQNTFINTSANIMSVGFISNLTQNLTVTSFQFNDTSTSLTKINNWNWSFGDGSWSNQTGQGNATHVFASNGTYTVTLSISNTTTTISTNKQIIVHNQNEYSLTTFNIEGITSWTAPVTVNSVDYLLIGGAGAGATGAANGVGTGGGGAGGLLTGTATVTPKTTYSIGIGYTGISAGGAWGGNGTNSNFSAITDQAIGGGGGAYGLNVNGFNGGSGGGGSDGGSGGLPFNLQGFMGGTGNGGTPFIGGGGGGSGSIGSNGSGSGNGGNGTGVNITGTMTIYAAGGGGGVFATSITSGGNGGSSLGGNGGSVGGSGILTPPTNPVNATGSGGGGGSMNATTFNSGTSGSSGLVILRYLTPPIIPPVVSFTSNVTNGVFPLGVNFNETSPQTQNISYWNWSLGDGSWFNATTEPTANISKLYGSGGNYTVILYATNDTGTGTSTAYITVFNQTASGFTANTTSGVAPTAIAFTVTKANDNATTWNWSAGDGSAWQNGSTQNFTHLYNIAGTFNVTEIAGNGNASNTTTLTNYITISAAPVPIIRFTSNVTTGFAPTAVQFNDISLNAPTQWVWNATNVTGNNTPFTFSTSQNPVQVFSTGNWSITLNATNAAGSNTSTVPYYINISIPYASFTPNVTIQTFDPMVILFNDTSSSTPNTWNWSFGDTYNSTIQNPTHVYLVANNYTVTENTTNSINKPNATGYVNLTTDDSIWLKSWLQFNNATVIDMKGNPWTQNGGAATSATNVKPGWGASDLAIQSNTANIASASATWQNIGMNNFDIEFWIFPTATGTDNIVARTNAGGTGTGTGWGFSNINGTVNGYSFWMGNTANASAGINIPNNQWTYIKIERSTNNTGNDLEVYKNGIRISSINQPTSFDTANPLRIGAPTPGSGMRFYMDEFRFDDGMSDDVGSPYDPPYIQYNGNLFQSFININPNATLISSKAWPNGPIPVVYNQTFHSRTTQIQNITNATNISFAIAFNPRHEFVSNVTLNASQYNDMFLSYSIDNVNGIVSETVSRNAGIQSLFNNRTNITDTGFVYYNYTDATNFSTVFAGPNTLTDGQHNVTYPIDNFDYLPITYGNWNFTADLTSNVSTVSTNQPVQFVSTFNGSYPNVWNWSFGDGTYDNGTNSTDVHAYTLSGTYLVNVNESLWQNNSIYNLSRSITINVFALPVANFTQNVTSGIMPVAVLFNDTSTNSPTIWNWSFGDGTYASTQNTTHLYASGGNYTVNLTASNTLGNASFTSTVTVFNTTVSGFTANTTTGILPAAIAFNVTKANDNATLWNWSAGDGSSWQNGSTQNFTHTYNSAGTFSVTEIAGNGHTSNTTTLINYITINPQAPTTNFVANITTGSSPLSVQFTDISTNSPTSWNWTFGVANFSNQQNPIFTFTGAGSYNVTLNASNAGGSNINIKVNFIVVNPPAPVASFITNRTSGPNPLAVRFTDTSSNNPTSWNWTFGAANFSNQQNPTFTFNGSGTYSVTLTVTNAGGSNTSFQQNLITVNMSAPTANFTSNITTGVNPLAVQFTDTSTLPSTWNWTFGDGNTSTSQNPVNTYQLPGSYTVSLNVSNPSGSNNITKTNYIIVGNASGINRDDLTVYGYFNLSLSFTDSTTGALIPSVSITDSNGNSYTTTNGTFRLKYPYQIIVINAISSGYISKSQSFLMDSDQVQVMQLTPESSVQQTQYTTTQTVRFICQNWDGAPIMGMNVSTVAVQTTLGSLDWVISLFGVNLDKTPILNTTMNGTTGQDGSISFVMLPTSKYAVHYDDPAQGINETRYYYPKETEYIETFWTEAPSYSLNGIVVSHFNVINQSNNTIKVGINYNDTYGSTDNVSFTVTNQSGFVIYQTQVAPS